MNSITKRRESPYLHLNCVLKRKQPCMNNSNNKSSLVLRCTSNSNHQNTQKATKATVMNSKTNKSKTANTMKGSVTMMSMGMRFLRKKSKPTCVPSKINKKSRTMEKKKIMDRSRRMGLLTKKTIDD